MQCTLCHMQYVGKAETQFNIRLNNHRKDINHPKAILACSHFKLPNHVFVEHAKYTIIEQIRDQMLNKEVLRARLRKRENFWIEKLETLYPKGFNQELNDL